MVRDCCRYAEPKRSCGAATVAKREPVPVRGHDGPHRLVRNVSVLWELKWGVRMNWSRKMLRAINYACARLPPPADGYNYMTCPIRIRLHRLHGYILQRIKR